MSNIFDYDDGDFIFATSDSTGFDSDGDLIMRLGDNLAMDMDTGEIHMVSDWGDEDDDW